MYLKHTQRVLIDDRAELGLEWEEKGGIFIHHTNTKNTLKKLKDAGIMPSSEAEPEY